MTTAAIPVHPRESRLPRPWRRLRELAKSTGRRLVAPHKAVLSNLASIPLTVAGFGCLDAAAFEWNTLAGLAAAGVLLIALEHLIADEP